MRIPRIYHQGTLQTGELRLEAEPSQHVLRVLRLREGDSVIVFNGVGAVFSGTLAQARGKQAVIHLAQPLDENNESPLLTHVGIALLKGERMTYALQKAVELGVTAITPVVTEYTVVRLDEDRQQNKLEHWQGILHSAAEQCHRTRLPELHAAVPLQTWLATCQAPLKIYFDAAATASLADLPSPQQHVALLTGPEGGLSPAECNDASALGFIGVRLGQRILRAETAVVAALSALQMRWGDFC